MKKRTVAILLALVLVVGAAIGGTVAWLVDQTGAVTNTFTIGDVEIDLTETGATNNQKGYDVVPGDVEEKDPTVTVDAKSVKCYLFISVTEQNNSITVGENTVNPIVKWAIADGWEEYTVEGAPTGTTYYYKVVDDTDADQRFPILKDNTVTIDENVTKEMVAAIDTNLPKLIFDSAAVQFDNVTDVNAAWAQVSSSFGV